ncbi:hypothetical protein EDC94DRAFT_604258, partial [Helicostylum pulchrum]
MISQMIKIATFRHIILYLTLSKASPIYFLPFLDLCTRIHNDLVLVLVKYVTYFMRLINRQRKL